MKKLLYLAVSLMVSSLAFISCDDEETYADQKEREAKQIKSWIASHDIDVISMAEFLKDTITDNPFTGPDFSRNEYVLFSDNGVYMQIIRRGNGRSITDGERWFVNADFVEARVGSGDTTLMNIYERTPDKFTLQRTGDNYTGFFTSGFMLSAYGSKIPNAWLMPFPFIKPGFLNENGAKVRLIVPHNEGTQNAASSVYAAYYEITISPFKNTVNNGND